jgi:tRNA pseudouridine13 synthase
MLEPRDWARAYPRLAFRASFKTETEDFQVEETLRFEPDAGDGEHWYVLVRSTGWNTQALARRIAAASGVSDRQVGYAGLKDKHAVTTQWFSVQLPVAGRDNPALWFEEIPESCLIRWTRHTGKLRIGAVSSNQFTLRLRQVSGAERVSVEERLQVLRDNGYPNYYGEQRFGWDGQTLRDACAWLQDTRGRKRRHRLQGIYLSCLRSWFFNRMLDAEIAAGRWLTPRHGQHFMKGDKGGVFCWQDEDPTVPSRVADGALHPALPLAVDANLPAPDGKTWDQNEVACLEQLRNFRLAEAYRATRVIPMDLDWSWSGDDLVLRFALPAGAYATGLLRELGSMEDVSRNVRHHWAKEQEHR